MGLDCFVERYDSLEHARQVRILEQLAHAFWNKGIGVETTRHEQLPHIFRQRGGRSQAGTMRANTSGCRAICNGFRQYGQTRIIPAEKKQFAYLLLGSQPAS